MWRAIGVLLVLEACTNSCPTLEASSKCVKGGLVDIDLSGRWALTGTKTTSGCGLMTPATVSVNTHEDFVVDGCKWGGTTLLTGSLDDTIAIDNNGATIVCVTTDGALTYQTTYSYSCMPTTTTPGSTSITGTLTR
jgi:hypothetical protein